MMSNEDVKRILYCQPETAGDLLISTGVITNLHKKFPNAKIYFATKKEYFNILQGNELIAGVIEYDESFLNYRSIEKWGLHDNPFDMVFCPFIVTQRIPHWIHSGKGEFLGTVYAHMCDVEFGEQFIQLDNNLAHFNLPNEFITIQSQTRQDPKDYDYMQNVCDRITGIVKVQIGGPNDKKLSGDIIDLRGKTTPQQLAGILFRARIHVGLDSFPMHIAAHVGCPVVSLFGGTYAKQGTNPHRARLIHAIETVDRGPCVTSCHLSECEAKHFGFDKCINNISPEDVLNTIGKLIGKDKISSLPDIKLSAYIIIKDGVKYNFPFTKCIEHAALVADEVVVVDGGSTDSTMSVLTFMKNSMNGKLKVFEHPWDVNCPTLMGDEKTWAKQQCAGNYTLQLDADELIVEPYPGATKELIHKMYHVDVIDLPCINFYGDEKTIRVEENVWKWRIAKNVPNIIHGVFGKARQFDSESLQVTFDKKITDGCEFIYADSLEVVRHKCGFNTSLLVAHEKIKAGAMKDKEYEVALSEAINKGPVIFHYSWLSLSRKLVNGEFWSSTWHGQKEATHNTVKDISNRINAKNDKLINVSIKHPMETHDVDNK